MPKNHFRCSICSSIFDFPARVEYKEDGTRLVTCPECGGKFSASLNGEPMLKETVDPKGIV